MSRIRQSNASADITPSKNPRIVIGILARARGSALALKALQLAYGTACVVLAIPLVIQFGPASNVSNGTSVRILGGALLALAVGAFSAARDPVQHRVMLEIEIVFTGLTMAFLAYRLLTHQVLGDRACYLLPPVAICLVLLLVLYPRSAVAPPAGHDSPAS